ncbi:ABC transporter [Anaerosporomusa subterranea]|uniref:ABC transporter n=1 Tax=Anaerosporomusa subterranea TaxID=1794912 RepID=A0A154BVY4_ANASB|nr:ABC-F family ATP-binding cassette domain-containing protein [Anaerosporomusa subterranea]KYZ78102.1 ABC transporter [Anaerosporomusa subterranea]
MNILTIENLAKSYGEKVLFRDVTFGVDSGDKIGLIGVNGTGKSTFLKVIAGIDSPDQGQIVKGNGITVEYLPQDPEFAADETVLAQVFCGRAPVMQVLRDYEQALADSQQQPGNIVLQKKLIQLSQQMDDLGGWQLESEAKAILTKLGIPDFLAKIGTLSGGQKKRVALARALITPSDLLILDEPTNHIDNDTVDWLEDYLHNRKGGLLMVTHDRYFLDRVATRIIELDHGLLYTYSGNYSQFLELKLEREERREASERKRQNLLRNELVWIRRGAQARSTKQKARIQRFEELSAQKAEAADAKLEVSVGASRLGRKIIELEHIGHKYDDRTLIADFSYIVLKNDRVGIVGPNGSGKSTLLNIITGMLVPDSGTVDIGQTVKIGYFSQESGEIDEAMTVIDYIKAEGHFLPTADGSTISASQMLERFMFPPNVQWTPIAKLSGGEKRRLQLLKVLMGAPNVLLLDEPTNDIDIQTLTVLEDYLDDFAGAVIVVSHDRYFLDRLVDKIFAFEGDGRITQYVGGYSDYRAASLLRYSETISNGKPVEEKKTILVQPVKDRPRKFTFKEQREFEQIDDVIASVESELRAVTAQLDGAGSDYELLRQLTVRQQELESRLDELLERWTYLNELAEEMQKT